MQITQAEDGLALSKMLLCQLCGIPMNQEITLADEDKETLALSGTPVDTEQQRVAAQDSAMNTRPELRMLQNALDISKEATKMVRAINLPHVIDRRLHDFESERIQWFPEEVYRSLERRRDGSCSGMELV